MATIGKDVYAVRDLLTQGQVVAIPTETVYGLAGNALNEKAVTTIFEVKNRPSFDPLIVHSNSLEKIQGLVSDFPETARKLARQFWPGPLTLLLPRKNSIPDLVTSGLETVAVRMPNHPLTLQLLEILDFPLAAPSANPFGYISPTTAAHVQAQLGNQIPYILDGGDCKVGIESTIVGFDGEVIIYRLGGIPIEAIEQVLGKKVKLMAHSTSNPAAPGMLKSHYAPRKPVFLQGLNSLMQQYQPEDIGILSFQRVYPRIPARNHVVLSEEGSMPEAARYLFAGLRKLDALPVKVIFAELLPEHDLGRAINDRIRRAAAR
jgi:L-threonylcarbamoyladenylate synthase